MTAALTSGGLFGTLMNLLVLWMAGRAMESELGSWRMVALYFAAGLGGTTLFFVFGPLSGRGLRRRRRPCVGLLAANSIFKHKTREDVRADIGLFVLLVLLQRAGRLQQLRLADADRRHRWSAPWSGRCWRTRRGRTAAPCRSSACSAWCCSAWPPLPPSWSV